jgi:outer membrane receptor protein involved in Fe transport
LSHDDFDNGLVERTPFNPKLGLTWTLNPETTVRAAAMRSMKRSLVVNQTIEPMQVSGFNQFFDDENGTDARRYGVAVDRRMGAGIFTGAELSRRDLESPAQDPRTGSTIFNDAKDWVGSGYVYAAITDAVAFSGEYQYLRLTRDPLGNNVSLLAESTTHRFRIEGRAFSRWGGFGRVRAWIVDQEGRFQNALRAVVPGSDRFVTVDASVGYRLPRRFGVVTIDIRNAFDEEFNYQDSTPEESTLVPVRQVSVRLTLTL